MIGMNNGSDTGIMT